LVGPSYPDCATFVITTPCIQPGITSEPGTPDLKVVLRKTPDLKVVSRKTPDLKVASRNTPDLKVGPTYFS